MKTRSANRRGILASLATVAGATAGLGASKAALAQVNQQGARLNGWYDARSDFKARGDGSFDDSKALQTALDAGSANQRPVLLPPGTYKITQPLHFPPNTMLLGSAPGLGFGCRIEPTGCAAFAIGGASQSFHCLIQDLMIWPKGPAPDCVISIDNSYSVRFRNIRIHDAQVALKQGAVVLLGDSSVGGHGRCNNVIWDNLVIRNDSAQPMVAVLATKGCGSHRFMMPDLENYEVLIEWRGGQLDLISPYAERAGRYGVNCNISTNDESAYFNSMGGSIDSANSGIGCAIRSTTRNFNSIATQWGCNSERAVHVYSLPIRSANFYGIVPNLTNVGHAQFSGVSGWQKIINFSQHV